MYLTLGFEKKSLWKEVLDSKYGGWRELRNQRSVVRFSLVEGFKGSVSA